MKKLKLFKSIMVLSLICNGVNAFADNMKIETNQVGGGVTFNPSGNWPQNWSKNNARYWPGNFPSLNANSRYIVPMDKERPTLLNFPTCVEDKTQLALGNPNYGTPTVNISYNIIVNVQNPNDKLRYDIYSKVEGKFIQRNIMLSESKNIISIQPEFINNKLLKNVSGDYVIIFKGIKYNGTYINNAVNLKMSIKDSSLRGCQIEATPHETAELTCKNHGALFYTNAKFDTLISAHRAIIDVQPLPFDGELSKVVQVGDSDPAKKLTCRVEVYNGGTTPNTYAEHVARLYVSIDAYEINLNGILSNYANPHADTSSAAYYKDSVSYDLRKILWLSN